MTITAEQVKDLRDRTGAGMMECKKALAEAAGDVEKAIDLLRKAGLQKAEKRADRAADQGLVESYIHPGNRVGVLIEVNCETDFVARTPEFQELVRNLAMQVAALGAEYVRREDVPAERIAREREIYAGQLEGQKKPANILEKIVEGKLEKFYDEICLLEQPYMRDDSIKVGDLVTGLSGKTGEKMAVRRFVRFRLGQD
jgi:elongation factor Ts